LGVELMREPYALIAWYAWSSLNTSKMFGRVVPTTCSAACKPLGESANIAVATSNPDESNEHTLSRGITRPQSKNGE
jgi:hypothetical protein